MKEKQHGEAIEKGLKELGITKEEADIRVLENEDKRSFFNILAPRVVKVEIINRKKEKEQKIKKNREEMQHIDFEQAKQNIDYFLKDWIKVISNEDIQYEIKQEEGCLRINIDGEDLNYLIGHRGEVLNTLEPMTAYERKIIHTKLQNSKKVTTTSVGDEPYRKIIISLK